MIYYINSWYYVPEVSWGCVDFHSNEIKHERAAAIEVTTWLNDSNPLSVCIGQIQKLKESRTCIFLILVSVMFLQSVEDYYIQLVYYLICTSYFIYLALFCHFNSHSMDSHRDLGSWWACLLELGILILGRSR